VVQKLYVGVISATGLILVFLAAAFASGTFQPLSFSSNSFLQLLSTAPQNEREKVGFYNSTIASGSLIVDQKGDAKPDQQYDSHIVPSVMGYHDILWAGVRKLNDNSGSGSYFLLTVGLAGDPAMNKKYETTYVWHIITSKDVYTAILPNFAPDSNFTAKGWYFAIYNNTGGKYVVPLTQISAGMPKDRVEFPLDASLIGNPESFHYWVSVQVRVDSQNLDKPPDYLMDYAP
jgi:hypothetical protein